MVQGTTAKPSFDSSPRIEPRRSATPITSNGAPRMRTSLAERVLAREEEVGHVRADEGDPPAEQDVRGGEEASLRHLEPVRELVVRLHPRHLHVLLRLPLPGGEPLRALRPGLDGDRPDVRQLAERVPLRAVEELALLVLAAVEVTEAHRGPARHD